MRRIEPRRILGWGIALVFSVSHPLTAFSVPREEPPAVELTEADWREVEHLLDAQLGILADRVSGSEREEALALLGEVWGLRQARIAAGTYEKSQQEEALWEELNQLYDGLTETYLGECSVWGYAGPAERTLQIYRIVDGESLQPERRGKKPGLQAGPAEQAEYQALWEEMRSLLPPGAFDAFDRFIVFTDGPDEVLAYVQMADWSGERWEIAVDPADAEDGDWFYETVIHEYSHYLTLNAEQVTYTGDQTVDTYNEESMVSHPGSYLDAFYQRFWTDYLEDRLADLDSYGFYLRHPEDFVTDYASSSPSEDIAESFTYFVLYDLPPEEEGAVWAQKLRFFLQYPELMDFRTQVQTRLTAKEA